MDTTAPKTSAPDFKIEVRGATFFVSPLSAACGAWLAYNAGNFGLHHADGDFAVHPALVDNVINGLIEHEFTPSEEGAERVGGEENWRQA